MGLEQFDMKIQYQTDGIDFWRPSNPNVKLTLQEILAELSHFESIDARNLAINNSSKFAKRYNQIVTSNQARDDGIPEFHKRRLESKIQSYNEALPDFYEQLEPKLNLYVTDLATIKIVPAAVEIDKKEQLINISERIQMLKTKINDTHRIITDIGSDTSDSNEKKLCMKLTISILKDSDDYFNDIQNKLNEILRIEQEEKDKATKKENETRDGIFKAMEHGGQAELYSHELEKLINSDAITPLEKRGDKFTNETDQKFKAMQTKIDTWNKDVVQKFIVDEDKFPNLFQTLCRLQHRAERLSERCTVKRKRTSELTLQLQKQQQEIEADRIKELEKLKNAARDFFNKSESPFNASAFFKRFLHWVARIKNNKYLLDHLRHVDVIKGFMTKESEFDKITEPKDFIDRVVNAETWMRLPEAEEYIGLVQSEEYTKRDSKYLRIWNGFGLDILLESYVFNFCDKSEPEPEAPTPNSSLLFSFPLYNPLIYPHIPLPTPTQPTPTPTPKPTNKIGRWVNFGVSTQERPYVMKWDMVRKIALSTSSLTGTIGNRTCTWEGNTNHDDARKAIDSAKQCFLALKQKLENANRDVLIRPENEWRRARVLDVNEDNNIILLLDIAKDVRTETISISEMDERLSEYGAHAFQPLTPPFLGRQTSDQNTHTTMDRLEVLREQGDGNCLFRAVAHQIYGDTRFHHIVRDEVCDHFLDNREFYDVEFLVDCGYTGHNAFNAFNYYVEQMRIPIGKEGGRRWGGEPEISAMSRIYQRNIHIWRLGAPHGHPYGEFLNSAPIRLDYQGGNHYNSIKRKVCNNTEETLWWSVRTGSSDWNPYETTIPGRGMRGGNRRSGGGGGGGI